MAKDRRNEQQKIKGSYEYTRHMDTHADVQEFNVWGRKVTEPVAELHEKMWNRFPGISIYRIPREVADRVDISLAAKIVYGFFANFPLGIYVSRAEVGGMCGLSTYQASGAIYDLVQQGLLEQRARHFKSLKGYYFSLYTFYKVIPPPKRLRKKEMPRFMYSKLDDLEEIVNARFYAT